MTSFAIAIDCADPYALLRFWSTAMGWEIEDNTALIEGLRERGVITEGDYIEVDGRLGWPTIAAVRDPAGGQGGRILFQTVPEAKTVKNRVHLDIHVTAERRPALVEELVALGGSVLAEHQEFGSDWVVLADPEGNELCLALAHPSA